MRHTGTRDETRCSRDACQTLLFKAAADKQRNAAANSRRSRQRSLYARADVNSAAVSLSGFKKRLVGHQRVSRPCWRCIQEMSDQEILLFSPQCAAFLFYLLTLLSSRLPGTVCGWKTIFSVHTVQVPSGGIWPSCVPPYY